MLQGSIRDNLLLENCNITEEELQDVADKTGIAEFMEGGGIC